MQCVIRYAMRCVMGYVCDGICHVQMPLVRNAAQDTFRMDDYPMGVFVCACVGSCECGSMGVDDGKWMLGGGCVCVRESESFQFSRVVSCTVKKYSGKDTTEVCRTESKEQSYSTLAYATRTHVILRYMI